MLGILFLLYQSALNDSILQVKLFLGLMVANMLFIMKKSYLKTHMEIDRGT